MPTSLPPTPPAATGTRWPRPVAVALAAVVYGLACASAPAERAVFASGECTNATPGASDYCASSECGPCELGEGDCDPGQCGAGLTCVEEGAIDRCRANVCTPGASDFCASWRCGPCDVGEGDCDPGQCGPGLTCVEEGAVDRCRPAPTCADLEGASEFCDPGQCGPCMDGEGDCDPGECEGGLECVEEGAVDRCRPKTCDAAPGDGNYCSGDQCGPCGAGEGDCDPGQCALYLECVEAGTVDRCNDVSKSNLEVQVGGVWKSVCCLGSWPGLSDQACSWTLEGRTLVDVTAGLKLDCREGSPQNCSCNSVGETQHGDGGAPVSASLYRSDGGPVYPNQYEETCVIVDGGGRLETAWTGSSNCRDFRLR